MRTDPNGIADRLHDSHAISRVAEQLCAGDVCANEVSLDQVVLHGGIVRSQEDAMDAVRRNDVARHRIGAADSIGRAEDLNSIQPVAQRQGAGGICADEVALNDVIVDAIAYDNAVTAAATGFAPGDYIAGWRPRRGREAADLRGTRAEDSVAQAQRFGTGNVCADEIALNGVTRRGTDADARVVGANHVARRDSGAADYDVVRSQVDACAVGESVDPGRVCADEVALNQAVRAIVDDRRRLNCPR